jgi:hypothetical protein
MDDPNQIVTVDKHFEASRAKSSSTQKQALATLFLAKESGKNLDEALKNI